MILEMLNYMIVYVSYKTIDIAQFFWSSSTKLIYAQGFVMPQVIVIDTEGSEAEVKDLLKSLRDCNDKAGMPSPMLIAPSAPSGEDVTAGGFFSCAKTSLANCIHTAAEKSTEARLFFINGQVSCTGSQLNQLIMELNRSDAHTFFYLPLKGGKGLMDFPPAKAEELVPYLREAPLIPFLGIAMDKTFLKEQSKLDCLSARELVTQLFFLAVSSGRKVNRSSLEISLKLFNIVEDSLRLTDDECARCLKLAAESFNIEDLFPGHNWNKFQNESMAACWHTLGALFLRHGDLESAEDCLKESDKLEDSPRSLALKALISLKRNEVLGAAGNMITSLQQYEARKRSSAEHYLSFNPKDLDKINTNLKTGLEALNRKDNQAAVQHFADAIFQFDSFYHENGIDRIQPQAQ